MNIIYFSHFYAPESLAAAFRATENSKIWSELGNKVTIFTGYPNYPKGRIFDGYNVKLIDSETASSGIKIVRSKLIAKPNSSLIKRLTNNLSFFCFGLVNIILNRKIIGKDYDVVLATSGPIFDAILGFIYARFIKKSFVFEIRDITYKQMKASGSKKLSVNIMKWIELYLSRKADLVVVVTHGFKEILIQEGIDREKISVITNGVDINDIDIAKKKNENGFKMGYFGTLGISQNIQYTFDYAKEIHEFVPEFRYIIIGSGGEKDKLSQNCKNYNFIKMYEGMTADELEPYYDKIKLAVVTLRKSENFKYTLPSKLFHIMGRGIAVLFIGPDGEAAEIIKNTKQESH